MYVSSYSYISSVCILLYMCPHTIYVSSYYYICVLILLYIYRLHTAVYVSSYSYISSVCILVYMCPHTTTTIHVSSYYYICVRRQQCKRESGKVSKTCLWNFRRTGVCPLAKLVSGRNICVRMLLYMRPHTTVYVSSYYYIYVSSHTHTHTHTHKTCRWNFRRTGVCPLAKVVSGRNVCVRMLLCMRPSTTNRK
jgi:hypothetical protein